jgi:hypothetical protein
MSVGFTLNGVTFQGGLIIQKQGSGGGGAGISISYAEMGAPFAGFQLQDTTAAINGTTGFIINDSTLTGVVVTNLSAGNQTAFNNLGIGTHTATLGTGSTYATISVNITALPNGTGGAPPGNLIFFFDQGVSYPATFNFPITIS